MRNVLALFVAVLLCVGAVSASAFDIPRFNLRAGARGGLNVSILSDVDEEDTGTEVYPGFVGLGWLVGGAINFDYSVRSAGIGIGIEFLYSSETGEGNVEWGGDLGGDNKKENSDFILEATALHIPLYVTGVFGNVNGVIRGFINVGADFAVNRNNQTLTVEQRGDAPPWSEGCSPGVDCDPLPGVNYGVSEVGSYTSLLIGFGMNIDPGPVVIPIEIRGLLRPWLGSSFNDRTEPNDAPPPQYYFRDEWQYQVFLTIGIDYKIF